MKHSIKLIFFSTLFIMIGFFIGTAVVPGFAGVTGSAPIEIGESQTTLSIETSPLTPQEQVFANVYEQVAPSVVAITVTGETALQSATGSGFVIDQVGHIVTNYHVVEGAETVAINFYDGTITRADVVGLDADADLAVLQVNVDGSKLSPVNFANSDNLEIGQTVLALGNPFQNDWTLTSGIVSALNRSIFGLGQFSIGGVIQTDAAINPGNSGGPLLNLQGEVVGVNSQIQSGTRANSGIGFAIPSNLVTRVVQSLIDNGVFEYSFMGIRHYPAGIDLDLIERYNLPNNIRGVPILQVTRNSPAEVAGLHTLNNNSIDIITAIDGVAINGFDDLVGHLALYTTPGQIVSLTVFRDGSTMNLDMTLAPRPNS